ncbi:hypothetical protein DSECCO2_139590 [anaerobic digester metagenome]
MVVAAQHNRADLAVANHLVELQRDVHAAHSVRIQDAALSADHHLVLLGVPQPNVVVVILIAAVVGLNVIRGGSIGLVQIVGIAAQAAPAEGTVSIVKQEGPQNVLDIGGEYKAVQIVFAVFAHGGNARIKHGLQERVAVIEEVGALIVEFADHLVVALQGLIHQLGKLLRVLVQHLGALGKGQSLRAVTAVIGHVARGLVAHQIHMDVLFIQILQQIHHVAVIGDGAGFLGRHLLLGDGQRQLQAVGLFADPALRIAGHDPGLIHFGDDGHSAGDLGGLALCAGHAAQTGGDEQASRQIPILGNAQFQAARAQQGVERAVDNALRPDVHPAAGGHLPIVGNTQRRRAVEVLLVVKRTDHQAVGDNAPGRTLVAVEQAQRVAAHDHQRLLICQDLQILFNQAVLHPVLADLPRFAIGHQLVGIQRHVEIEVILDHDLKRLTLGAVALVLLNGLAV